MPELIQYEGQIAAIATARRAYLAPEIERLPDGHPDKRFVACMVLYAMEVQRGQLPGPFRQDEAEAFALAATTMPEVAERGATRRGARRSTRPLSKRRPECL
jgi:hypothetical protein